MYQRILVALDGSDVSEQALPHAEALAEKFGSTLVLLRAYPILSSTSVAASSPQDPTQIHRLEQQVAERYLAWNAERLRAKGHTVETALVAGTPAEEIVDRAKSAAADLIVMTTHGRGGLGRLVFGSVADEVLRKAACPVLLVRVA